MPDNAARAVSMNGLVRISGAFEETNRMLSSRTVDRNHLMTSLVRPHIRPSIGVRTPHINSRIGARAPQDTFNTPTRVSRPVVLPDAVMTPIHRRFAQTMQLQSRPSSSTVSVQGHGAVQTVQRQGRQQWRPKNFWHNGCWYDCGSDFEVCLCWILLLSWHTVPMLFPFQDADYFWYKYLLDWIEWFILWQNGLLLFCLIHCPLILQLFLLHAESSSNIPMVSIQYISSSLLIDTWSNYMMHQIWMGWKRSAHVNFVSINILIVFHNFFSDLLSDFSLFSQF